jgi:hypothetical protein
VIEISIPEWIARPLLRLRALLLDRERARTVRQARAAALADVNALLAAEGLNGVRASLAPGRAHRGWDGGRHLSTIPERQRSRFSRAYYVASRDHGRSLLRASD